MSTYHKNGLSSVPEAKEVDPIAAVAYETFFRRYTRGLDDVPEFRIEAEAAAAEEDLSGNIVLPLEQTPEEFVSGLSHRKPNKLDLDELVERYEEYKEKDKPTLTKDELRQLWSDKYNELETLYRKKQSILKKEVATWEEGEIVPPKQHIWEGANNDGSNTSANLTSLGWDIKKASGAYPKEPTKIFTSNRFWYSAQEDEEPKTKYVNVCDGCKKSFTTKASLQRHIERKAGCKTITEKKVDDSFLDDNNECIVEWVEGMMKKSISGEAENALCKGCDIEFANKSNLVKHLSKSPACNKLAKIAFLKLLYASVDKKKIPDIANKMLEYDSSGCVIV